MTSASSVSALPLPPGPRGLPVLGSLPALRGTLHVSLNRLVQPYGDICLIRLGSVPVAIISHPQLLAQAFGKAELTDRWITDTAVALNGGQTPVTAPYGNLWRQLDAFIRHGAFGDDNLTMLRKNHIEPEAGDLVARMVGKADAGEPVHPNDMLSDSACRMALRTYFLVDGEDRDWAAELERVAVLLREHFEAVNTLTATPVPGDLFPRLRFLPSKAVQMARRLNDDREEILGPLLDRVRSRPGFDPSSPGCLAEVVLAWEMSGSLSRRMMCGMLADTMQPHFDGVAVTVKWFLLTVANRPRVQAKIHEELDRVVGRDALPTMDDRGRLPYTFAAIAECMRHHTASPLGIPHEASQDTEVGGCRIPAGAKVFGNLYGIHHDSRFWNSPHEFIPERFLPKADGSPSDALTGGAFIPFGAGLRRCTGERPAEIEIWLYIARLMHRLRFEVPGDAPLSEDEVHGMTVTPRPYALKATRR